MDKLLKTRLLELFPKSSQVTNEEMEIAYGGFMEQVRTISQSEQNYSDVFRKLNATRIELIAIQALHRYEQGKKCA